MANSTDSHQVFAPHIRTNHPAFFDRVAPAFHSVHFIHSAHQLVQEHCDAIKNPQIELAPGWDHNVQHDEDGAVNVVGEADHDQVANETEPTYHKEDEDCSKVSVDNKGTAWI